MTVNLHLNASRADFRRSFPVRQVGLRAPRSRRKIHQNDLDLSENPLARKQTYRHLVSFPQKEFDGFETLRSERWEFLRGLVSRGAPAHLVLVKTPMTSSARHQGLHKSVDDPLIQAVCVCVCVCVWMANITYQHPDPFKFCVFIVLEKVSEWRFQSQSFAVVLRLLYLCGSSPQT